MADKIKPTNEKEIDGKLADLKLQLLNQKSKRKDIKKEIARLLTFKNQIKTGNLNK